MVDLASAAPAWGSFTLVKSALGQKETRVQHRRLLRFTGAIILGTLGIWLFFALHRWWG
jgi:hypothetical protein